MTISMNSSWCNLTLCSHLHLALICEAEWIISLKNITHRSWGLKQGLWLWHMAQPGLCTWSLFHVVSLSFSFWWKGGMLDLFEELNRHYIIIFSIHTDILFHFFPCDPPPPKRNKIVPLERCILWSIQLRAPWTLFFPSLWKQIPHIWPCLISLLLMFALVALVKIIPLCIN